MNLQALKRLTFKRAYGWLPRRRQRQFLLLSVLTYGGAATAVVAPERGLVNVFNPQTNADLVALLGLIVATMSLAINAYLRWATLRLAQQTLAHTKAMAERAHARGEPPPAEL